MVCSNSMALTGNEQEMPLKVIGVGEVITHFRVAQEQDDLNPQVFFSSKIIHAT